MSKTNSEIEIAADQSAPLAIREEPSVAQLMQAVIDKGITESSVSVLKGMMDLKERMDAKQAEKDFNAAFNALQSEIPVIETSKAVPDKNGNIKFRFAPFEEIMGKVRPLLLKHGFTVAFSMDFRDGRVIVTCTLSHSGGHSRANQFFARVGSGPYGASETQADGAANTYAKRYALCNALNIVTGEADSDDARIEGEPITFEQAETLREMVRDTGSDEARFLRYAGAAKYEEIMSSRYQSLFNELNKKARK